MPSKKLTLPDQRIDNVIREIRGVRIILDSDLAALYGVPTKRLNEQFKRNRKRFPEDFAFQLTAEETTALTSQFASIPAAKGPNRSQIATGSQKHRDPRLRPYAFTEHGALMAANVLNSSQAVKMSLYVIRAFVKSRDELAANSAMVKRLAQIDNTLFLHDSALRDPLARRSLGKGGSTKSCGRFSHRLQNRHKNPASASALDQLRSRLSFSVAAVCHRRNSPSAVVIRLPRRSLGEGGSFIIPHACRRLPGFVRDRRFYDYRLSCRPPPPSLPLTQWTMIKLHPEVLKKNGVSEFVILPYDEFVALQKLLADAQDLADLREAVRVEGGAPTISLEELKTELGV